MSHMHIRQIYLNTWSAGSKPEGTVDIQGPDAKVQIPLTEAEARQLISIAMSFFQARQRAVANSIANMTLPQLTGPAPEAEDAEFEEVVIGRIEDDD